MHSVITQNFRETTTTSLEVTWSGASGAAGIQCPCSRPLSRIRPVPGATAPATAAAKSPASSRYGRRARPMSSLSRSCPFHFSSSNLARHTACGRPNSAPTRTTRTRSRPAARSLEPTDLPSNRNLPPAAPAAPSTRTTTPPLLQRKRAAEQLIEHDAAQRLPRRRCVSCRCCAT